jgi:predicted RNA binding protein YcfA (HicA-like mRNA interferase family)
MAKNLVSFRKAQRTLWDNGFTLDRISSSHYHYVKDGTRVIIPIRLNRMLWQRIVKENNLEG